MSTVENEGQKTPGHNLSTITVTNAEDGSNATKVVAGNTTTNNPALAVITAWMAGASLMGVVILAYLLPMLLNWAIEARTAELRSNQNNMKVKLEVAYDWANRQLEREKLKAEEEKRK